MGNLIGKMFAFVNGKEMLICRIRFEERLMLSESKMPTLVVGDDTRIFLSIVRSLGRAGKTVYAFPFSPKTASLSSRYISKTYAAPDYTTDPLGWKKALLEVLSRCSFELVIPCADPAIMALDEFRNSTPDQIVAIPSRENIVVFFDKAETHRLCAELGIAHARFTLLTDDDSADSLINRFGLLAVTALDIFRNVVTGWPPLILFGAALAALYSIQSKWVMPMAILLCGIAGNILLSIA